MIVNSPAFLPYFAFEQDLWQVTENAELRPHRFERVQKESVLALGRPGRVDEHRIDSVNVLRENDRFVMWYLGMRKPGHDLWHMEDRQSVCVAYSDDGVTWERPNFDTGRKRGRGPNNVLPDVSGDLYGFGILREPDRYIMTLMHPRGLKRNVPQCTFSMYTSTDGLRWRGARRPCTDRQHFESGNGIYQWRGWYYVTGQGISPYYELPGGQQIGRMMYLYRSRDLRRWEWVKKPAFAYPIPKYFPEAGVQNHTGATVVHRGRLLLGTMGQFWPAGFSESVRATIGLIYSTTGVSWREPFPAEPFLMPSETGWDCGMLFQGNGMYSRGGHTYYWYSGLNGGNLWSPSGSVGLCCLRRDGFASFGAARGASQAVLETVPLALEDPDTTLYVNSRATPKQPIRVSVLAAQGPRRLASVLLRHDQVFAPARELSRSFHGREKVRFRFELTGRSRLFSFYLGPDTDPSAHLSGWRMGA